MTALEQLLATAVSAIAVALVVSALLTVAGLGTQARRSYSGISSGTHIQRLLDSALSPPAARAEIAVAEPRRMVVTADLNGDGLIDERSAETTTFELTAEAPARLRHRLGRQVMTLATGLPGSSELLYLDGLGEATMSAAAARAVILSAGPRSWTSSLAELR